MQVRLRHVESPTNKNNSAGVDENVMRLDKMVDVDDHARPPGRRRGAPQKGKDDGDAGG